MIHWLMRISYGTYAINTVCITLGAIPEIGYVVEQLQMIKATGAVKKEEDHPHTGFMASNWQKPAQSNAVTNFT